MKQINITGLVDHSNNSYIAISNVGGNEEAFKDLDLEDQINYFNFVDSLRTNAAKIISETPKPSNEVMANWDKVEEIVAIHSSTGRQLQSTTRYVFTNLNHGGWQGNGTAVVVAKDEIEADLILHQYLIDNNVSYKYEVYDSKNWDKHDEYLTTDDKSFVLAENTYIE